MPTYLVQLPSNLQLSSQDGVNAGVVTAANATDARAVMKASRKWDANAPWDQATVTVVDAASDMVGFSIRIRDQEVSGVLFEDRRYVSTSSSTPGDFCDELTGQDESWSFDGETAFFTLRDSDLGDHVLEVGIYAPSCPDAPIPGLTVSLTHRGDPEDVLGFTVAEDDYVLPKLHALATLRN